MRTLLVILLAAASITPAYADGRWEHHGHGGGHHGGWWILPAIVTGAVVYEATRPQTVYVEPVPVVAPPPVTTAVPPAAYWYYCPTSRTYYPNVATCASNWQMVPATPPAAPPAP